MSQLIQLDDNTIINPKQILWALRLINVERYLCQPIELCFIGRYEEKRTVQDPTGRVWVAIKSHAEGNG